MKKLLSMILALVMCLGLAVPALAEDLTGNELFPENEWGEGPALTLTGVVGEREAGQGNSRCYDVEAGGSLVLDMAFPAGEDRSYAIGALGLYLTPDFTGHGDDDPIWEVPAEYAGGNYSGESGETRYVYQFTESDIGQQDGLEKVVYIAAHWGSGPEGDGEAEEGYVYFYVRVVPPEDAAPADPETSVPAAADDPAPVSAVSVFSDVDADADYAVPVAWAAENHIAAGTAVDTFSPGQVCTNAQILAFLYRAYGEPVPAIDNPFADVNESDYYYNAALWAAENGMVSGGAFDADGACTRAMAVTYLWQAAGSPETDPVDTFADVSADDACAQAVAWAVEKGVIGGVTDSTFSPADTCQRGEIVAFLYSALAE